jgi:glycosyltransferase involved in cell wall biosynthesis
MITAGLRVSVVIPVYNEEGMIRECLDAIRGQTVTADEIIVVDNNSTDSTGEILRKYDGQLVVLHEARQGVCHARNTGLDAAHGDVIGRIDADTRLPPWWIERVHGIFADPMVQAATGPTSFYDILLSRLISRLDLLLRTAWAWSSRQRLDWTYGANMAIRASAWRAVRPSLCNDGETHEDVDLGIHLYHADQRVIFSRELAAATSSRRIRDRRPDFRSYLAMTERGYASHPGMASAHSYLRAWLTARLLIVFYFPLHLLNRAYLPGKRGFSFRALRAAVESRKNPMSGA